MRIVVLPPRGVTFPQDSSWLALIRGLVGAGHEVSGYGYSGSGVDAVVTLNHQPEVEQLQSSHGIGANRTALVVLEPLVTAPAMYRRQALSLYGHRFAASPLWSERVGGETFLWPQELRQPTALRSQGRFSASLVNGDKRSAVKGSLYGLRRNVIQACDESSTPLAVFGPGWDHTPTHRLKQAARSVAKAAAANLTPQLGEALSGLQLRPRHWLGIAETKAEAFAAAPNSIIIENSSDYVSEKLIDAVCAGVAPIYVGPPLTEFHLPRGIAIECEPRSDSILVALRTLTPDRQAEIVAAGRQWLQSNEAHKHGIQVVLEELGRRIGDRLRAVR